MRRLSNTSPRGFRLADSSQANGYRKAIETTINSTQRTSWPTR